MNIVLMMVIALALNLFVMPSKSLANTEAQRIEKSSAGRAADVQGVCPYETHKKSSRRQSSSVIKTKDMIVISTPQKTVRLVNNDTDDPEKRIFYDYIKRITALNSHLIGTVFWEGSGYLLVHDKTGEETYLDGQPLVSPDQKHFVALSMDMEAGYNPTSVEVWKIAGGHFLKVAIFEPEGWGPDTAKWVNASKIEVVKMCFFPDKPSGQNYKQCGKAHIMSSDKGWILKE